VAYLKLLVAFCWAAPIPLRLLPAARAGAPMATATPVEAPAAVELNDLRPRATPAASAPARTIRRDDALLVQSALGREIHDIDAAEPVIWRVPDEPLDCRHDIGVGRLPQDLEHGLGIAHVENHIEESGLEKPHWRERRIAHSRHRRFLRLRALE